MPVYDFRFPANAAGLSVQIRDAAGSLVSTVTAGAASGVQGGVVVSASLDVGEYTGTAENAALFESYRSPGFLNVDSTLEALPGTIGSVVDGRANTFEETQTFDPANGLNIGDKLSLNFVDGFFGQRLHLTGLPQPVGQPDIMPYLEVVPTTLTGTDVGGAIAGLQVYRTQGGGGVPNREFLAIEASGDLATMPGFKIATWASGTGVVRPLRIVIGVNEAIRFQDDANIKIGAAKRLFFEDTNQTFPIIISKAGGALTALQARHYVDSSVGPYVFLAKNRGTIASPTLPNLDDILGEYRVGAMDGTSEQTGGGLRILALQSWDATKHGSILTLRAVPKDTTASQEMAAFSEAETDAQTAFLVRVNRAGTKTRERVTIGAPDSGGTGYRVLRVAN